MAARVTLCNAFEPRAMFTVRLPRAWLASKACGAVLEIYAERFEAKHGAPLPPCVLEVDGDAVDAAAPLAGAVEDGAVVVVAAAGRGRRARRASLAAALAARGRDEEALVALAAARAAPARAGDASDAALDAARGDRLEALGRLAEAAAARGRGGGAARAAAALAARAAAPRAPERRAAPSFPATARGLARAAAFLDEHGYAVVRGAAAPAECEAILGMLWDWLEGLGTGLDRGDAATWVDGRWPLAAGASGAISARERRRRAAHRASRAGILPHHGAGHCAGMWAARRLPAVRAAFGAIWRTDDLLASRGAAPGPAASPPDRRGAQVRRPRALPAGRADVRALVARGPAPGAAARPRVRPGLRGDQPLVQGVPTKLQTSRARSNRRRCGWFWDESIAIVEFPKHRVWTTPSRTLKSGCIFGSRTGPGRAQPARRGPRGIGRRRHGARPGLARGLLRRRVRADPRLPPRRARRLRARAPLCAGTSGPNFRTLYLGHIEVDSAEFWTSRLLSSSS